MGSDTSGVVQRKAGPGHKAASAPTQSSSAGYWLHHPMMDAAHRGVARPIQALGDLSGDGDEAVQKAASAGVSDAGTQLPHFDQIQRSFGAEHDVGGVQAHIGGAAAVASDAIGARMMSYSSTPEWSRTQTSMPFQTRS